MNYWCEHCKNGLIDYCDSCFACDVGTKETPPSQFSPRINADKVRVMSTEEIAILFSDMCPPHSRICPELDGERTIKEICKKCWLEWLKQEAENDKL